MTDGREKANILILGGGVGGLVSSNLLKKELKDRANVILIERKRQFQFPPSYPWLMLGERTPEQVQKDLELLKKKGIDVICDEVRLIDLKGRIVKTKTAAFPYDYLIIALGAEYDPDAITGFREYAHHIYDLESTLSFRDAIEDFAGGTIAIGIARTPFKCPAAPYEVSLLLEDHFSRKRMREKVNFEFFTPEGMPLPAAGPDIGSKVVDLFKVRGINYHAKLKVTEISQNELRFESGERIRFDLLFCVPPHKAPQTVVEAGLTDGTGWIPVDPRTLETRSKGVYAVGDVTALSTPQGYTPYLPKAGVFAHGQAEVVTKNIATQVLGRGRRMSRWDGHGACFLEVAQGKSAFLNGDFLADPRPKLQFHAPGKKWHLEKVVFEKYWMYHWF